MIFLLISSGIFCQDTLNTELKQRIYTAYTLDQTERESLRKYFNNELDTTQFRFQEIKRRVLAADSINFFELRSILDTYGFPGYNLVGEDYSNSFWNLVQHQDDRVEFQKEALQKMKIEVDRKNASAIYYAYLTDRVKVNAGEEQVYGTQMVLNADSTSYEPQPVTDRINLDKRRNEVGLPPIGEYIETMNKRYFGTLKKKEE